MSRAAFYHSPQWRKLSRAFLLSRNYICQRCGAPAEIAHHKQHLTAANVSNPEISLNPDNLEALCLPQCRAFQRRRGDGGRACL